MRGIVIGLLCAALLPAAVSSQSIGDLTTGQRLPVSVERRLTGTLVSIDNSSLDIDAGPPSGQLRYRLDQVRHIEVSTGRRSRFDKARGGLLAGAALGGLLGTTQKGGWLFSTSDFIAMGASWGAAAGFVVGLALPRGEKWAPVSIAGSGRSSSSIEVILGSPRMSSGRP